MFFQRTAFFKGNRERLQKCIQRENGKLLKDQQFTMIFRSDKVKRHTAIPFCFRCKYEKSDNGYQIRYSAIPTWLHFVLHLVCVVLLGLYSCYRQGNPLIWCGSFILLSVPNYFIQRSRCIRLFEAVCNK